MRKKSVRIRFGRKFFVMLILVVGLGAGTQAFLWATNYNVGTLDVVTFADPVTWNGSSVTLNASDTLTLSGGTMTITGGGGAYSALLGSGAGAATGFLWGTGGTISLNPDVTLAIDVASGSFVPLTQTESGTLNLTASGTQNFQLTQNAGTLNVSGDLATFGDATIDGILEVAGDLTANVVSSTDVEVLEVNGTLNVGGAYNDRADQTNVYGTLTAQSANFFSGGLDVESGGSFVVTDAAIFSANTAIINKGNMEVGDDSELGSSTIADSGTMTLGAGTTVTGVLGNSGTVTTLGNVEFNHVTNLGTMTVAGDALFTGEFYGYGGTVTIDQTGTFQNTAEIFGGSTLNVKENVEFENGLTLSGAATVDVTGDVSAGGDIDVTDATLISGGNISTTEGVDVTGNSTLGLSNRLQGANLGNLTAGTTINLASTTTVKTDLSGLSSVRTPTLLVHMTAGDSTDDFTIDGGVTDVTAVGALFGSSTVLRQIYAEDNGSGYDIYGSTRSLGDYAQDEGLEEPAIDAGNAVDDLLNNTDPSNPAYDMAEDLLGETDKNVINETLYHLAGGYGVENIFSMTLTNLGQAGSPFFLGKATGIRGRENHCSARHHPVSYENKDVEVWGAPFYQSLEGDGNFYQDGFNAHETGVMVGIDKNNTSRLSAGVLFAYGAPRLNQMGSLSGYDASYRSDLDMDDYQFAGHVDYETANHFRWSAFVGGGAQRLGLRRNAWGVASNETVMNQNFTGHTDGNTLSATVYLERPFCLTDHVVFSPIVGVDAMFAWLYSFTEDASGTGSWQEMTNLSEGNFYSPVSYKRTDYNRVAGRVGFRGDYSDALGGISFQAFYGTQLGGEDYAVVPVSTLGGALNNRIYGYGIGRDSLNLGGGIWRSLNDDQTVIAAAQYNYWTLADANASNVTASFSWRY